MPPPCFVGQSYGLSHVTLLVAMSVRAVLTREVDFQAGHEWMLPDLVAPGLADNVPARLSQVGP